MALKNTLLLIGEKSDPSILLISNADDLSSTLDERRQIGADKRRTYYMEIKLVLRELSAVAALFLCLEKNFFKNFQFQPLHPPVFSALGERQRKALHPFPRLCGGWVCTLKTSYPFIRHIPIVVSCVTAAPGCVGQYRQKATSRIVVRGLFCPTRSENQRRSIPGGSR